MNDIRDLVAVAAIKKKLVCPICLRLVQPSACGMLNHVKDKHSPLDVIQMKLLPPNKTICQVCSKIVHETGLEQHMEHRHG